MTDDETNLPFDELLTIPEVAQKLRVKPRTVPVLLKRHGIATTKLAHNQVRLSRWHYWRLLAACTGQAA